MLSTTNAEPTLLRSLESPRSIPPPCFVGRSLTTTLERDDASLLQARIVFKGHAKPVVGKQRNDLVFRSQRQSLALELAGEPPRESNEPTTTFESFLYRSRARW